MFDLKIIGLSASPGVGKAKAVEKAEENIKTLMANLDVTLAPVEVVQHVASLRKFQNSNRDGDLIWFYFSGGALYKFISILVKFMRV